MNEGLDLSSTLSKIKNSVSLSGKNRGFLANTFSKSQSIDKVQKVKLLSHIGFSDSDRVAKKMDKVELRGCLKSLNYYQAPSGREQGTLNREQKKN
ncbi:MAG: hypothetical protein V7K67_30675 [Nostoc sp.]|uniref:hypothetical protein n=1 Tax=Nostoc sp. TaxID=1180 RepID=UPI002FF5E374